MYASQEATKGGEQQCSAELELSWRTLVLSPDTSKANTRKRFQTEVLRVFVDPFFLAILFLWVLMLLL